VPVGEINLWFARQPSLEGKRIAAKALGFIGNKESVELLIDEVSQPRAGESLNSYQELTLTTMVSALGFQAFSNALAWDFIVKGCDPRFWETRAMWKPARNRPPTVLMAAEAIRAVGCSGHPDALAQLYHLKSQPLEVPVTDKSLVGNFEAALMSAAFALHYNQHKGREAYHRYYLDSGDDLEEYTNWRNSEAGRPWAEWRNERFRARGKSEIPNPYP
jgi:hypothetical protein